MPTIKLKNFKYGLDSRRSELESQPGTLVELENAHINQGGEIEKRKAFVYTAFPADTFGAQATSSGIVTFGSITDPGGWSAISAAVGETVYYQRLQHPAVLFGETYDAASHAMTEIIFSEAYGRAAFVNAVFADGSVFQYYDGELVDDFIEGMVLSYQAEKNVKIAKSIKDTIDTLDEYEATQITFATTHRARTGGVATLTVASTSGLLVGQSVDITGMSATYNKTNAVLLAPLTATTINYAISDGTTEGTTVDSTGVITSSLISVEGQAGVNFSVLTSKTSVSGSFGVSTTTTEGTTGNPGSSAVGSFSLTGGRFGGEATGTLTISANVTVGANVTIGRSGATKVYTFVNTLTTEGDVKLGVSAAESMQNLINAINHLTNGATYQCAEPNADVVAGDLSGGVAFTVVARIGGAGGNSILTTETSGNLAWGSGTLTGGVSSGTSNNIASIKVVSPLGPFTELLQSSVDFVTDLITTCEAVVTAINDNTDVSGYTATLDGATISIFSSVAASPQPNNYNIVVTCNGNVCVGECFFYFQAPSNVVQTTEISVGGVDVQGADLDWPAGGGIPYNPATLTKLYYTLEAQINAGTTAGVAHGIIACAHAGYIQLSKRVTSSEDLSLAVYVTFATGTSPTKGGVVFTSNPNLREIIPSGFTAFVSPLSYAQVAKVPNTDTTDSLIHEGSYPVVCNVLGGTPPYTYKWIAVQGPPPDFFQLSGEQSIHQIIAGPGQLITTLVTRQFASKTTYIDGVVATTYPERITNGKTYFCQWICRVTDVTGATTLSDAVTFALTTVK